MGRKLLSHLFLLGLFIGLSVPVPALEKVRLGTASKVGAVSYPPILTAEQRGLWKENGLEVEWIPFAGAAPEMRAVATGALNIGISASDAPMTVADKGVPVIMVAEYISEYPFYIWVRTDSPYRHILDLKGAKIGVTTLGGTTHAYARVMAKSHGIEKDVRFVGAGGTVETFAGFRAGAFEAMVKGMAETVDFKLRGIIREIASTADYIPKPWVHQVIFVRKDFALNKPDVVRKVIKATLQATDFMQKSPRWTIDLMKSFRGYSEQEAKLVYEAIQFNATGKINRKGVENARKFYIEYGILIEKAPPVDELFTNEYLPG